MPQHPWSHHILRIFVLIVCLFWVSRPCGHAQVPSALKSALGVSDPPAASSAPEESPADQQTRLQQWLKEARETLARLEDPAATPPQGVSSAEFEDRRRNAEQSVLGLNRCLKALSNRDESSKSLQDAQSRSAAWQGFKETPPFSILLIDELQNERDAVKEKLTSSESSLSILKRSLTNTLGEAKSAEDSQNQLLAAVEKTDAAAPNHEAAKWRADAARTKSRLLSIRIQSLQIACSIVEQQTTTSRTELALLDRKIQTAKSSHQFTDEDFEKLTKISNDRKAAIQKEIETYAKRQKTALASRKSALASLDELSSSTPEGSPPPAGLDLAKFRLEVADFRVDTLQAITENLESLTQLEATILNSYQDRRSFLTASSDTERKKALASLSTILDRLKAWDIFIENEISRTNADLAKIESRSTTITGDDPRFPLVNEQRAATSEKQVTLQRLSQAVTNQRRQVQRWIREYTPKDDTLMAGVTSFGDSLLRWIQAFWSFEVTTSEQTFKFEGETITRDIPVTLGQLIWAFGAFAVLYFIASRVVRKIQFTLIQRGHIAEAQARTLRNWAMIVVGVILAIVTLNLLGIPLTVFAFFGGALAIGLGFGTQTLIKNFISGIIMLFERKIRVGDVLDLGGVIGTVTEINTRSSVVRSGDGVETLVPNSTFLENRVTNLTLTDRQMRRTIRVGISYGSSPRKVMAALKECVERHGLVLKTPEPFVVFADFGDNALLFDLYFWVESNDRTNAMIVASDIRLMIDKRLQELGIGVPFPQRDMHLTTDEPLKIQWAPPPSSDSLSS